MPEAKKINVSPSRLRLFLDCKWAYFCKYVLKLPDEGNPKTSLGSLIHEILEILYKPYSQEKRKKYILYVLENDKLHPIIEKIYFKKIKTFNIPKIYGKKDENLHELGLKLTINALKFGYNPNSKCINVEKEFVIPVSENVNIKGFIDKVSELDKDTIELTDYKSGAPYSYEKCGEELQPYFYKIAAQHLYKNYKNVLFNFHFLKNKKIVPVVKTEEELIKYLKFIISQGKEMLKFTEKDAITNKTWSCDWCKFKKPNKDLKYTGCPAFYDKEGKSLFKNYDY